MAVTLQLGGTERTLRFNFGVLRRLEERGHYLLDSDSLAKMNFSRASVVGDMLWAACLHFDPALKPEDTDAWITDGRIGEVSAKVVEAYLEYLGGEHRPRPPLSGTSAAESPLVSATDRGSSTG